MQRIAATGWGTRVRGCAVLAALVVASGAWQSPARADEVKEFDRAVRARRKADQAFWKQFQKRRREAHETWFAPWWSRRETTAADGLSPTQYTDVAVQRTKWYGDWGCGKQGWQEEHVSHRVAQRREFIRAVEEMGEDSTFGAVMKKETATDHCAAATTSCPRPRLQRSRGSTASGGSSCTRSASATRARRASGSCAE